MKNSTRIALIVLLCLLLVLLVILVGYLVLFLMDYSQFSANQPLAVSLSVPLRSGFIL